MNSLQLNTRLQTILIRWHLLARAKSLPNPAAYQGNIFISHAGADSHDILRLLVHPMQFRTDTVDAHFNTGRFCFFHSTRDGMGYVDAVFQAMRNCSAAILIASANSTRHPWVRAEAAWLLARRKPVCVLQIQDADLRMINRKLESLVRGPSNEKYRLLQVDSEQSWGDTYSALDKWLSCHLKLN